MASCLPVNTHLIFAKCFFVHFIKWSGANIYNWVLIYYSKNWHKHIRWYQSMYCQRMDDNIDSFKVILCSKLNSPQLIIDHPWLRLYVYKPVRCVSRHLYKVINIGNTPQHTIINDLFTMILSPKPSNTKWNIEQQWIYIKSNGQCWRLALYNFIWACLG
jgi:hypothetical protein